MATVMDNELRADCMYGERCYRKNPDHLQKFKHPPKRKLEENGEDQEMESAQKKLCNKPPPSENGSSSGEDEFTVPKSVIDEIFANKEPVPRRIIDKETLATKPFDPKHDIIHDDYAVQNSPQDVRLSVEQKFLLDFPDDFYDLWDLCTKLNKDKPEEALIKAGLTLVGPYDVLTGKLKNVTKRKVSTYVCHWRYYYDPPEFMTVIAGNEDEYHIGYYRDEPFTFPIFVASMSSVKPGVLNPLGENIFAGVCSYIAQKMKLENPFKKTALQRLYTEVESYAKLKKFPLEAKTPLIKERNRDVCCKTFHGAGIIVPIDENDVGYRPLPESYADIKKILRKVADAKTDSERLKHYDGVHEIINNVQFAFDEGDTGMGLELGLNLFTFGGEVFHKAVFHLLSVAYELLGREPFIDIIQAHLQNRRRGSSLSILDVEGIVDSVEG